MQFFFLQQNLEVSDPSVGAGPESEYVSVNRSEGGKPLPANSKGPVVKCLQVLPCMCLCQ